MILVLVALACVSSGCRKQEARERQDLDFTVCAETELPDDLRQIIEEKKLHAFQMSYTTKDHLYIVVGYGEHDRTNLCVVVEELYKTDRAIYIKTDLKTEAEMEGDISGVASGTDSNTPDGQTGDAESRVAWLDNIVDVSVYCNPVAAAGAAGIECIVSTASICTQKYLR